MSVLVSYHVVKHDVAVYLLIAFFIHSYSSAPFCLHGSILAKGHSFNTQSETNCSH